MASWISIRGAGMASAVAQRTLSAPCSAETLLIGLLPSKPCTTPGSRERLESAPWDSHLAEVSSSVYRCVLPAHNEHNRCCSIKALQLGLPECLCLGSDAFSHQRISQSSCLRLQHVVKDNMTLMCYILQRFASGSLFKRTVFQYIAQDLAADPAASTAVSCLLDSQARPVVTLPSDSPLQTLLSSLDLEDNDAVDRHRISEGLQRLGKSCSHVRCNAGSSNIDSNLS